MIKMFDIEIVGNRVKITGNVKSITHYNEIKSSVDSIIHHSKDVVVELVDSISLTSSVIGYFTKIVNVDSVSLKLYVSDERLYELLNELGVAELFNVQRIKR